MASREELLQSIQPNMKLDKAFFLKVYADEITHPGFANEAIKLLKAAGCSRANEYYNKVVSEYEQKRDAELKEVAHWWRMECDKQWEKKRKEGEERRIQETIQDLQRMSDRELLSLLQRLN